MPKRPILYRETFFDVLRDGTLYDLDWNSVNTSIGAMVEPRMIFPLHFGKTTQRDPYDTSFNKRSPMSADEGYRRLNTWGQQIPRTYNTQ